MSHASSLILHNWPYLQKVCYLQVRLPNMNRRDFFALSTLRICSMSGCISSWQRGDNPDLWQIGEFVIRTSISDGAVVTVNIRDDGAVVYDQELTLPAVEEGNYREIPVSGYPTEPGLYTVTCTFGDDTEEYRATITPTQTAGNPSCYNLYPRISETGEQRFALMMRNLCYEEAPTGE